MSLQLHPDALLRIHLRTICHGNRYTSDPGRVICELVAAAGEQTDLLAMEAGQWAGYYDDEHTAQLVAAIMRDIPGAARWAIQGMIRGSALP